MYQLSGQEFIDVTLEAGIDHVFEVDLATFGGGAAVIDIDNDGFEDVYITGGNRNDVLYYNNGDGSFTNIFDNAGFDVTIPIHTQGAAAADVNRDGFKDLLITTMYYEDGRQLAPNLLFINNGDMTFTDVTTIYGLDKFKTNSMGAAFGDINLDGYPDLYVANYFSASPEGVGLFNDATITNSFAPAQDYFFLNVSGSAFQFANEIYGIDHVGFGFEGSFTDWDNDRDVDILLVNDFGTKATPNVALLNEYPEKNLRDRGNNLRLNYGMNAMGIAVGDVNFDGWMDYFVSNVGASLYVTNIEGEDFIEQLDMGLAVPYINNSSYQGIPVSWGANFFDYDHDEDLDLFVANGALNPTIRPNPNFFFELTPFGFYREVGEQFGLDDQRIGRGSVVFDFDNDGDLDILVINQKPRDPAGDLPSARCILHRNDAAKGNWLKIQLDGVRAEKNGLGSRIEVKTQDRLLVREIDGGSSHMSHSSTIAHFGLGTAESVESVTVKWLGGNTQELSNVSVNQLITIRENIDNLGQVEENDLFIFPSYFTDQMLIEYSLTDESPMDISVYDAQGRLIQTLVRLENPSPNGFWFWDGTEQLIHGMYFVQLRTKNGIITKKAMKI
jgi:hypothetical protein